MEKRNGQQHRVEVHSLSSTPDVLIPPSKHLQVAYVIPIRGEIHNGNFFNQIKDFTQQQLVEKNTFEVIYARNATKEDIATQNNWAKENETIRSSVEYIHGEAEMPEGLEVWQQRILEQAKGKELRVQTISIPIDVLEQTDTGENIERARIIGENRAVNRFRQIGREEGAIVMLDADARIPGDMTDQMIKQLVDQPDVGMLKIRYDHHPGEGGQKLFETTGYQRFEKNIENLRKIITGDRSSDWYAVKAKALGIRSPMDPHLAGNRDLFYIDPDKGEMVSARGVKVTIQDRARPYTHGGFFGSQREKGLLDNSQRENTFFHPALTLFLELYHQSSTNIDFRTNVADFLHDCFPYDQDINVEQEKVRKGEDDSISLDVINRHGVTAGEYANLIEDGLKKCYPNEAEELDKCLKEEINRGRIRHVVTLGSIESFVRRSYTQPTGNRLSVEAIQTSPGEETREAHFLRANPWILEAIEKTRDQYVDAKDGLHALSLAFPNFLLPFEDTPYSYPTAKMLGFIRYAENKKIPLGVT